MKLWWAALGLMLLLAVPPAAPAQAPTQAPVSPPPASPSAPPVSPPVPPASPAQAPRVAVNDVEVSLPAVPEVRNGILIAPLAPLVSAFGGTAAWDPTARTVTITGASGAAVHLTVGTVRATSLLSGEQASTSWDLPEPPFLRDGAAWGPVAAVLRGIGAYVREDPDAGMVEVVSQVTGMTWRRDGGTFVVTIAATGPVHAAGLVLGNPDRVVVDLTSAVTRLQLPEAALAGEGILRVRSAQFHVRPYVTRVVFDLAHPLPFKIATVPAGVVVALGGGVTAPGTAASPPGGDRPPTGAAPPPPSGGGPVGAGPTPEGDRPAVPVAAVPPQTGAGSGASVAPEPLALPPLPDFADAPGVFHVRGATYGEQDGVGRVTIRASQPLAYTIRQFVYPDRLAIDISGGVFLPRRQDVEIGSASVRNVVVSQFRLRPNVTRVLVHLNRKTAYTALASDGGRSLVVMLGDTVRRGIRGSAVIIDPGHGGADGGAIGPSGLREADVALSIGRLAQEALGRQGVRAVLTRTDDTTVALEDRPDLAQRYGGIVFVSIHANAGRDPNASGTETYYKTLDSRGLAAAVQAEVAQALGEPDRGIRTADFYVLVNTPMPSVLVETAFITNPAEESLLRDPAVQRRIADAIARAVVKFLAAQHAETP